MRRAESRTSPARGSVLSNGCVGVTLADGETDQVGDILATNGHESLLNSEAPMPVAAVMQARHIGERATRWISLFALLLVVLAGAASA